LASLHAKLVTRHRVKASGGGAILVVVSVVAVGRIKGIGVGSGAEIEVPIGFVSRFRDGRVVMVKEYLDPDEALEAAELRV
jgi:ketosteroid isomerase-like protein